MSESVKTRVMRWQFNFFPAYRRTGGRIIYISSDLKQIRIKIPLSWKTRNIVGTIFGGSMYGAVDPIYMVMFIKLLGNGYIVWDKSASIEFKIPGRSSLQADFEVDDNELEQIRNELNTNGKTVRSYQIELRDKENQVCALVNKTLYFKKKD